MVSTAPLGPIVLRGTGFASAREPASKRRKRLELRHLAVKCFIRDAMASCDAPPCGHFDQDTHSGGQGPTLTVQTAPPTTRPAKRIASCCAASHPLVSTFGSLLRSSHSKVMSCQDGVTTAIRTDAIMSMTLDALWSIHGLAEQADISESTEFVARRGIRGFRFSFFYGPMWLLIFAILGGWYFQYRKRIPTRRRSSNRACAVHPYRWRTDSRLQ